MRSLLRACLILIFLCNNAEAKIVHWKDIAGFTKVIDMYKRWDEKPQPYVWKTSEKGVALLSHINNQVNENIPWKDFERGKDYWQTPKETLDKHGGDCEDLAILKMYYLLQNGFPEEDIYILQGVNIYGQMHAILQVIFEGKIYYLDNLVDDINFNTIKPLGSYTINRFGVTFTIKD